MDNRGLFRQLKMNTRDSVVKLSNDEEIKSPYQKVCGSSQTYLGYVVGMQGALNPHIQIYFPTKVAEQYQGAESYSYQYISEEYPDENTHRKGKVYHCHLRGVEICPDAENYPGSNSKEAHIFVSKKINESLGWVLVSVSDIDVYKRLLVNIFDIKTRMSINSQLLDEVNYKTDCKITRPYNRPTKNKIIFNPAKEHYHFVYVR